MAKKEVKYKEGQSIKIVIGGVPDFDYVNKPMDVEEYEYVTPPIPHKSDILFYELPKKDQLWRRIDYPKIFYDYIPGVTQITTEERNILVDCVSMDKERRVKGLWFMNNGIPTYITGNNYFFLQWGDMLNGDVDSDGNSYPSYYRFQRDYFYFIDIVERDENCKGGNTSKAKKTGCTQMMAATYANEGTLYEKIRLGVMSKTGDECRDTNMAMIFNIINKMPQIIVPKRGVSNTMEISFANPSQKPTGTKQYLEKIQQLKELKVLNTTIVGKNTKVGAFDGPRYKHVWVDEHCKYWQSMGVSPKELFDKDSAAVMLQQSIKGKFWITNYTSEIDDRGFQEAKVIYYDSKKSTIDKNSLLKRTRSGLYAYHISSLFATEGTFDIYGEPDVDRAFKLNDEERKNAKGDKNKIQALIRQYSRNEDESWMEGGSGSAFDNDRLMKSQNEKDRMRFMKKELYRRGNFRWQGARFLSPVVFESNPDGRWYLTRMIPEYMTNTCMFPSETESKKTIIQSSVVNFVGGIDPFSYMDTDATGNIGGSKGVSYTLALPNSVMDVQARALNPKDSWSKRIISWYSERPADANDFFEDMVMETIFFGKSILIENNKEWLNKKFKDAGMSQFLLLRNTESKVIEKYHPNKKQKEVSTQSNDVDEFCRIINEYLSEPKSEDDPDYCMLIEDVDLISQLMKFNPLKTKIFDRVMALAHAILALNSFSIIKKTTYQNQGINIKRLASVMLR